MSADTRVPCTSRGWFFSEIPADWKSIPLKYACDLTSAYGANIPAERYVTEGVRFLRTTDITDSGKLISGGVFISEDDAAGYVLEERDLLISRSGTVGRSFLYDESYGPCAYAGYLIRYQLKRDFEPKYLFYLTKSAGFQEWIGTVSIEATIGNVNGEKYANFSFPAPAFQVQRLIADYLDRETARIDGLIAEKERMLGLLEEKRAALISRVVTRGLDPNAPLKPSGQEWLGEIPAHWEVPPVYARFEVQLGKMLDEKKIKGTHLASYLRNVDVQWGVINTTDLPEMDFDDEGRVRYALRAGDILVCEGGEIGRSAIWGGEIEECFYQKALHRLRSLHGDDDAQFFVFVMFALVNIGVFTAQSIAATIQHLPAEKLRNVRFPAPPLAEQRQIVAFLNQEVARIQTISKEIANSVSLLKERRAALITAAVTGQIPLEEMRR